MRIKTLINTRIPKDGWTIRNHRIRRVPYPNADPTEWQCPLSSIEDALICEYMHIAQAEGLSQRQAFLIADAADGCLDFSARLRYQVVRRFLLKTLLGRDDG